MSNEFQTKCPLCNHILYKRYEGLVCKNHKCKLYFKLGKGWVYLTDKSREYQIINSMWDSNSRLRFNKKWIEIKAKIIQRDNYKCQFCEYNFSNDFDRTNGLEVHHIIPASKESTLFLDEDNLITVCKKCHKKLHSTDKYKF